MDLAPVLDIDARAVVPGRDDADGLRSFGGSAAVVSADGVAFMRGLAAGGVVAVVKHFPGLGGVSPNTDYGAASTAPWSVVQKTSLGPFRAAIAAGAPALMVSNATIPGLSAGPAVLSRAVVTGVIRTQLGFRGLILTDSLSAGAISAFHMAVPAAAAVAVVAGADLVLFSVSGSTAPLGEANRVSQALLAAMGSGQLSRARIEASVARVLAARGVRLC
jgi:beta-N-acetylhexosaminidase